MTSEDFNSLYEDEDVVIEGSELHQALINVGLTNFNLTPKVKIECNAREMSLPVEYKSWRISFRNKMNSFYYFFWQENKLRKKQLKSILSANILLDDHALMVNELICDEKMARTRRFAGKLPFLGTVTLFTIAATKKNIPCAVGAFTILGISIYKKFSNWTARRKLRNLLTLQRDVHDLIKHSLKLLRRHLKKSGINEASDKNELIGGEKWQIVLEIKNLLLEIFENLSNQFYVEGNNILNLLPTSLHSKCSLTKIDFDAENNRVEKDYNKIKNLYYTYILVQSELMFILANAYNGKIGNTYFKIPNKEVSQVISKFNSSLTVYYSKLSYVIQTYKSFEVKPVTRVFRGTPASKWQDTYIHLDLTSHRIQLAYKEIVNILELIDANAVENEDDLVESITTKMNEAYKQLENARSFAEFSSLLIAKAQHKTTNNSEPVNDNENLFPVDNDNRNIVMLDEEPEIEDEVFEEYIREEYLKPLYESSDGSLIDNYKLDKLLKKNFMSELKDALIDKQKSMTERELKALRRMYQRVRRDSFLNKPALDKPNENNGSPVPPPPPPPPPPIIPNRVIVENHIREEEEEEEEEEPRRRPPVPLPRIKMMTADDPIPYVQKFSISECTPNFKFPAFKTTEETFLGSGENSEEEEIKNTDCSENGDAED